MYWFIFALLAYLFIAGANIVDKILVDKYIKDSSVVALFTGTVAFIFGIFLWFLRGFPIFSLQEMIVVLVAGMFLEFYLIPYFKALEKDDPSRVIPLFQFVPVFTLVLSYFLLQEKISQRQGIGFLFITMSGFMLSFVGAKGVFSLRPAFWYMIISSFIFAISLVLFKSVLSIENVWDSIAYESLGMGIGTFFVSLIPGYAKKFTKYASKLRTPGWAALAISESLYVIYRILLSLGLAGGSVAIISVLGGFQPLFVFLIGVGFTIWAPKILREAISPVVLGAKLFASLLIFIGLYFLYI